MLATLFHKSLPGGLRAFTIFTSSSTYALVPLLLPSFFPVNLLFEVWLQGYSPVLLLLLSFAFYYDCNEVGNMPITIWGRHKSGKHSALIRPSVTIWGGR